MRTHRDYSTRAHYMKSQIIKKSGLASDTGGENKNPAGSVAGQRAR